MSNSNRDVVVITGASAGVGRAAAQAFGERKCRVGLIARGLKGLEGAKQDVENQGGEAVIAPADVADFQQVEQAANKIEEAFGPIDIWVNCAMTTVFGYFWKMSPEEYRRVTEVTYLGFVHGTMIALKRMRPRNRGTIIQVGSALSYRAIPLQSAYCGAKFAIRGFTDSIRSELISEASRIHITMVQMPGLNTPQFTWCKNYMPHKGQPVPPIYQPEVAARAIVWSAYHRRRELNVGTSSEVAIWGNKFVPSFDDWYLAKTAVKGQQYDGADDPNRKNNLFEPVDNDTDKGAHGPFDDRARATSPELSLFTLPGHPYAGVALLIGGVIWAGYRIALSYRRKGLW